MFAQSRITANGKQGKLRMAQALELLYFPVSQRSVWQPRCFPCAVGEVPAQIQRKNRNVQGLGAVCFVSNHYKY